MGLETVVAVWSSSVDSRRLIHGSHKKTGVLSLITQGTPHLTSNMLCILIIPDSVFRTVEQSDVITRHMKGLLDLALSSGFVQAGSLILRTMLLI